MQADNSEHGSDFHWLNWEHSSETQHPWSESGSLWASGRDALRALWEHGAVHRGWKRLWIPLYFCQEVVDSLEAQGVRIARYADGPLDDPGRDRNVPFQPGDVLLDVNYFGLRTTGHWKLDATGVEIIEDHTHDPWSRWARDSKADWCIASLRKTLPLPEGGVLWSPRRHASPPQSRPTRQAQDASIQKLAAMVLKSAYLDGRLSEKQAFRQLMEKSEESIACGPASGMPLWSVELLSSMPVLEWREHRKQNHQHFATALQGLPWVTLLQSPDPREVCPFSATMVLDSEERRDDLRQRLIAARVYPSILWSLPDAVSGRYSDLSRRILSVHCDMRYTTDEIERLALLVRQYGEEFACTSQVEPSRS